MLARLVRLIKTPDRLDARCGWRHSGGMQDVFAPLLPDPLGAALHGLRLSGVFYCRSELGAPWGTSLPELPDCVMFHAVVAG